MPNSPPVADNLNGDGVTFDAGGAPVRLDALGNAAIGDPDPFGFEVIRVGLASAPMFMVEVPDGSGRMYVVERSGTIRILDPSTGTLAAAPFLDVTGQVAVTGEQGLLGFALAPDFATSGVFYIYMSNTNGDNEVRRYSILPGNMDQADGSTADRILLIPHPGATNHNGGWIGFGLDNMLYIPTGDGAVGANAQSLNSLLGKVLRVDPSSDAFPGDADRDYSIPAGNPYAGATSGLDEIWASGLRNPFRASFDTLTGNLWIGDVGQNAIEEIDLAPAGQAGLNFGWNLQEGTNGANNPAFTRPVAEYGHGSGAFQGNSVTGGLVYHGPIAGLDGQYVFADFFDEVWSVPVSSLVQGSTLPSSGFTLRNTAFTPNAGTINQITSFATDAAGNLYITDLGGEVFRVQVSAAPNFAGGRLSVEIGAGEVPTEDQLGFAAGSVDLSNGANVGSRVSVGGVLVGAIAPNGTGANGEQLIVLFNSGATPARISTLVQAVTYSNAAASPTLGTRSITIQLNDGAGTGAGGQDTAIVTTKVAVSAGAGGQLAGTSGDDVLVGGISSDRLDGRSGRDTLDGRGGNDTYYVDNAGDNVIEAIGTGSDTVISNTSYRLAAGQEIELLRTYGSASTNVINLTGNELANMIQGNAAANVLDGKGGSDVLRGYGGNDRYYVDRSSDTVIEAVGQGTDTIITTATMSLYSDVSVEVLRTPGSSTTFPIHLAGNDLDQTIAGNAAANSLNGFAGHDILWGYGGNDSLIGGVGADDYVFSTAPGPGNVDAIHGFVAAEDRILIDNAVFTGFSPGALAAGAFHAGPAATEADDRIVYNTSTGALYFDADGVGGAAAVQFATLSGAPLIAASDIWVV